MALKPETDPVVIQLQADRVSAGNRLDVFLANHVESLTRSAAGKLIAEGRVTVVGRVAKAGLVLRAGELVAVKLMPPVPATAQAQNLPLVVLYQDEDLAVVDKPPGMVTHPAAGHEDGTLVNALLHHVDQLSGVGGQRRPGIVHRLDKDTSGLLLVAKNDRAHLALSRALQSRDIHRRYDALVWDRLVEPAFTVSARISRDTKDRKRFTVTPASGKSAVTHVRVQQSYAFFSLLRLELETGRTHQIRVHCKFIGHPVVGDPVYGCRSERGELARLGLPQPQRQLLHAAELEFIHPFRSQPMTFMAPWPPDFAAFLEAAAHPRPKRGRA